LPTAAAGRDGVWIGALLRKMRGRHIAVLGDLMLDEWLWGSVRRISPEAPVPVVDVQDHSYTLGGAGNVANNLAALGAKVSLLGVIGRDDAGKRIIALCKALRVSSDGIISVAGRPTTQKTRIVAHHQQVVRADRESAQALDADNRARLLRALRVLDGQVDGVVISDYAKGLLSAPLVAAVKNFKHRPPITGDPKPANIDAFAGIDCIAPNVAELQSASGITVRSDEDLARAAQSLLRRTACRYVLVTRGEHGMTLFSPGRKPLTVPAVARQVYDVSGAGDTVMSTLTLALAVGAPIERAVALAALGAGVVVEKLGTATASAAEIERFALSQTLGAVASRTRKRAVRPRSSPPPSIRARSIPKTHAGRG
jgi:D-beta-D-heptose 7-phosphate kinase/D-beta-D-heptose 1-phosphate adenosyltransferase